MVGDSSCSRFDEVRGSGLYWCKIMQGLWDLKRFFHVNNRLVQQLLGWFIGLWVSEAVHEMVFGMLTFWLPLSVLYFWIPLSILSSECPIHSPLGFWGGIWIGILVAGMKPKHDCQCSLPSTIVDPPFLNVPPTHPRSGARRAPSGSGLGWLSVGLQSGLTRLWVFESVYGLLLLLLLYWVSKYHPPTLFAVLCEASLGQG